MRPGALHAPVGQVAGAVVRTVDGPRRPGTGGGRRFRVAKSIAVRVGVPGLPVDWVLVGGQVAIVVLSVAGLVRAGVSCAIEVVAVDFVGEAITVEVLVLLSAAASTPVSASSPESTSVSASTSASPDISESGELGVAESRPGVWISH